MAVHEQLEEVVRTFFSDDEIILRDDLTPADVPGWDSLAHVGLMFSIEEAFGIQFSDDELADFSNVGDLERTVERKLEA
jgi:acyl carrier protein